MVRPRPGTPATPRHRRVAPGGSSVRRLRTCPGGTRNDPSRQMQRGRTGRRSNAIGAISVSASTRDSASKTANASASRPAATSALPLSQCNSQLSENKASASAISDSASSDRASRSFVSSMKQSTSSGSGTPSARTNATPSFQAASAATIRPRSRSTVPRCHHRYVRRGSTAICLRSRVSFRSACGIDRRRSRYDR